MVGLAVRWAINKISQDRAEEGATVSLPPAWGSGHSEGRAASSWSQARCAHAPDDLVSGGRYFREVRLDVFLEVDFRVLLRLAGLRVRLEAFRAEDVVPRVPVLFEVVRARPLVFFERVVPPDRFVVDPAVDFRRVPPPTPDFLEVTRRRASAPTPAAPAAPAVTRRGRFLTAPAAPLAARAAPLATFFALLCFLLLSIPLPP